MSVPLGVARANTVGRPGHPGQLVATDLGTVHALVRGDGPALVLLHGVTASAAVWDETAAVFAREATVHALDLAGHGLSDIPSEPWDIARMADGVAAYLDAAGIRRAVVCGWSLGGGVALGLAARWPERVASLVLLGSIGLPFPKPATISALRCPGAVEAAAWLSGFPTLRARMARSLFHRGYTPGDDWLERYWSPFRVAGRGPYLRALLGYLDGGEPAPWLPGIRVRAHVVHGDADAVVPLSVGQGLSRCLSDASLYVLGRTGHTPHVERPAETAAVLRDALAGR